MNQKDFDGYAALSLFTPKKTNCNLKISKMRLGNCLEKEILLQLKPHFAKTIR